MSEGKKQITLTNDQAQFLYMKLNDSKLCPMPDLDTMRKITRVMDELEDKVVSYEKKVDAIREKYREFFQVRMNPQTGESIEFIPEPHATKFNEEVKPLSDIKIKVTVDREALEKASFMFGKIVPNSYKNENGKEIGMGGRYNSRMFVVVIDAINDAQVVKE